MSWKTVASCDYEECPQKATVTVREEGDVPEQWFELNAPTHKEQLIFCSASCLMEWAGSLPSRPSQHALHA